MLAIEKHTMLDIGDGAVRNVNCQMVSTAIYFLNTLVHNAFNTLLLSVY